MTYTNISNKTAYYKACQPKKGGQYYSAIATNTGLYLLSYEMEAISFNLFLYEEAVQWSIKLLKLIRSHKDYTHLRYFLRKFYKNIWHPALSFAYAYGPLNPYSWPGFKRFFEVSYAELCSLDAEFGNESSGYSER